MTQTDIYTWFRLNMPDDWTTHPNYPVWIATLKDLGVDCPPGFTASGVERAVANGVVDEQQIKAIYTLLFL